MINKNELSREQKVEAIKALLSGKTLAEALPKEQVIYLEFTQRNEDRGFYYDKEGNRISEQQKKEIEERASQRAEIVWNEIKTY
jgi:hypothetical protein